MVIDAHTHIFPDRLAEGILNATAERFGVLVCGKGTAGDLLAQMDASRVSYAVVHMVSVNPSALTVSFLTQREREDSLGENACRFFQV